MVLQMQIKAEFFGGYMRFHLIFLTLLGLSLTALAACGDSVPERGTEEMAQLAERAADLRPSDPRLRDIYERSCINCHSLAASSAPLTGDAVGWAPRLAKGNTVLMENTIGGFQGMPPMGMCSDCSVQEFRALIEFLATGEN